MELSPSEELHVPVVEVRRSLPSIEGVSALPETFVHTDIDCWITASISFSRPPGSWLAVRIVTGFVPSAMLHWRLIDPGVEISKRVSCGQEVPPDCDAALVISATVVPRSYAPAHAAVICSRNRPATAMEIALRNLWPRFPLI